MSAELFEEFLRKLRPFGGLWQSAEFAVIAVGDRSGDFLSLATNVVLRPQWVDGVNVLRHVPLLDLATPILAARVEYPLTKALNESAPLKKLVEAGRFELEVRSSVFPVRLYGIPARPEEGQSGFSWTKVLDKSRAEMKAQFGIDHRCIALLNTYDSAHVLCRLVTDDLLKEINSNLRARPHLIDGLDGLMSELMPGVRLSMDACPPARIVAPLPFDLGFQPEKGLIVNAPEAAFARGMEVSVFFRPAGDARSFQLGVANSVDTTQQGIREWQQRVSWPSGAQTATAVLLYAARQIMEISLDCLPDSTPPVAHAGVASSAPTGRQAGSSPQPGERDVPPVQEKPPVTHNSESVEDWESITPAHLVPPIEHIRTTFDESLWKCSEVTMKLCFAALHPDDKDIDLEAYESAFISYRAIIGPRAAQQFDKDRGPGTPSAIFHAFLQVLAAGIRTEIDRLFNDVLQIGRAHEQSLKREPADWAKAHLSILINGNKHIVRMWVQSVCDKQDYTRPLRTDQEFEDFIHWRDWRAPKLIYMQPSGNLPYDPSTAWTREDEVMTERLLEGLPGRVIQSLGFHLDRLTGSARVEAAKVSRSTGSTVEGDDRRFARMAIEEALKSVPEDERPHPKVGALVVKDGRVLSKAHRGESPKSHAEYIALEQRLPDDLIAGATVYTTLEPCTTRKHPKIPCAQRLIDRRVARVVIGMLDPNPEILGRGVQALRDAGIQVQFFPGDLEAQVEELNREFTRIQKQRQTDRGTRSGKANHSHMNEVRAAELDLDIRRQLQNIDVKLEAYHQIYRPLGVGARDSRPEPPAEIQQEIALLQALKGRLLARLQGGSHEKD